MTRRTMRIAAALGSLVLAASMTACAGRGGTAATVGGERITVSEVEQTTEALAELQGSVPGLSSLVLNVKMRGTAAEQIAAAQGINLRERAEKSYVEQGGPATGQVPEEVRDLLIDAVSAEVLENSMAPGALGASLARVPVTVNPRYGLTGLEPMRLDQNRLPVLVNRSLSKPHGAGQ